MNYIKVALALVSESAENNSSKGNPILSYKKNNPFLIRFNISWYVFIYMYIYVYEITYEIMQFSVYKKHLKFYKKIYRIIKHIFFIEFLTLNVSYIQKIV